MQGEVFLEKYVIVRHIGGGGMAQVYLADKIDTPGSQAAIKVMNTEQAVKARSVERFKRECSLLCSLDHPHIVRGFEYGPYRDRLAIAMEYIEGPSLEGLLEQRRSFSVAESLKLLLEIAEGLDHLHTVGGIIAHRDIKPGNILIGKDGGAKITDLGIAKALDEGENLTGTSSFLGSPHYMSPEQILDPKSVDIRADLYALGAMFFEMITGQKAYPGSNTKEILDAHFNLSAPTVSDVGPYTDLCNEILEKTLADNPSDRFTGPRDLIVFLAPALGEDVRVAVLKRPKQRTWMAFAAVLTAIAVIVGGVASVLGNSTQTETPSDVAEGQSSDGPTDGADGAGPAAPAEQPPLVLPDDNQETTSKIPVAPGSSSAKPDSAKTGEAALGN